MSTSALDPVIHNPERLRVVATLAALPGGDALRLARPQDMLAQAPGHLIIRLHELGHAGYVRMDKTSGNGAQATAAITRDGRAALDHYTAALRRPAWPSIIRHRHPGCGPAMLTGTRPPRHWGSTSRWAG